MASSCGKDVDHAPVDFDVEASGDLRSGTAPSDDGEDAKNPTLLRKRRPKPFHIDELSTGVITPRQDIYMGSYAQNTPRGSVDSKDLHTRPAPSPRESIGRLQIEHLLKTIEADLNNYGVLELRDGFFGASFFKPLSKNHNDEKSASISSGTSSSQPSLFSLARSLVSQQVKETRDSAHLIATSRAGIKLLKSFLGVFVCYIICLIPASRDWLGRYNYIIAVSAIINHPGRKVGSQIDGALLTILGTVAGLGWGSLALYVSTSDETARKGYGGVLAVFLIIFTMIIGWLRCVFIRFYQALISAGLAIFYMCLADTSQSVTWLKVFDYGIPFVLGQAICLLVATLALPDVGCRSLA